MSTLRLKVFARMCRRSFVGCPINVPARFIGLWSGPRGWRQESLTYSTFTNTIFSILLHFTSEMKTIFSLNNQFRSAWSNVASAPQKAQHAGPTKYITIYSILLLRILLRKKHTGSKAFPPGTLVLVQWGIPEHWAYKAFSLGAATLKKILATIDLCY